MIVRTGTESLIFRRKIAKLLFLFVYKVLYRLLHMPDDIFIPQSPPVDQAVPAML